MSRLRRKPTLVDLTVMALSPALVMLMVGSLVFFLVEVLYAGQYTARLLWTLGCFVFAAVLLARVAIEVGVDRARLLGGVLAVVTYLALAAYVKFPEGSTVARFAWAINLLLMALIWFAADRLTWDCTHVDDKRQASDMGLLLASGLAADPVADSTVTASTKSTASATSNTDQPSQRKPHTPGLWVVRFALAAVPLFGLLGSLIPASEPGRRRYAVLLVGGYLVGTLGLLLTTSFLGVRRYLRQRDVSMPRSMTALWLGAGGVLVVVMVFVAMVLPRPYSEYALLRLTPLGSQDRQASSNALQRDSAGKGDGRPGEKVDAKGQVGDQPGQDGKSDGVDGNADSKNGRADSKIGQGSGKDGQAQSKDNGQRDKGTGRDDASSQSGQDPGKQSGGSQSGKSAAQQGQPSSAPQPPPVPTTGSLAQLAELLRWLVLIVGVLAVVGLVVWWLVKQLGRSTHTGRVGVADARVATPVRRATFADYADPFATGLAESKPIEEVVAYSFEALQAWANDHNAARRPDETALEFATRLGQTHVPLQAVMRELAALSSRAAFAADQLDDADLAVVRRFWRELAGAARSTHAADASAE